MLQPEPDHEKPDARIHCRVSSSLKRRIEAAARLTGQTVTSFTEMALAEKAGAVLQDQERIRMSEEAFEEFLGAIGAPPAAPSERLLRGVREYRDRGSAAECPS